MKTRKAERPYDCKCGTYDYKPHFKTDPHGSAAQQPTPAVQTPMPWKCDPRQAEALVLGTRGGRLRTVARTLFPEDAAFIVRAVNSRQRHIEALVRIKIMCEKQIVENPMGKTIAPEIHALVMKALDSYDVQDALLSENQ